MTSTTYVCFYVTAVLCCGLPGAISGVGDTSDQPALNNETATDPPQTLPPLQETTTTAATATEATTVEGTPTLPPDTTAVLPSCRDQACPLNSQCQQNELGGFQCLCNTGFVKDDEGLCVPENPCIPNPCVANATCRQTDGQVECICPPNVKGPQCSEPDPLVNCTRKELLRIDLFTTVGTPDTGIPPLLCLNKADTMPGDLCFDPSEALVYSMADNKFLVAEDSDQEFCISLIDNQPPTEPRLCVEVTASEADDLTLRPWRNDTTVVCFIFNRQPRFKSDTIDHTVNVGDPNRPDDFIVEAVDPDENQELTYEITDIQPSEMDVYVTNDGSSSIIITNPVDTSVSTVTVSFKVTDNGVPELSDTIQVTITFVNVTLACKVNENPLMVPLDPLPPGPIGRIQCAGRKPESLLFHQNSDLFQVTDNGDLLLTAGIEITPGEYQGSVVVEADGLTASVEFTAIAGYFKPSCDLLGNVEFSENDVKDQCQPALTCSSDLPDLQSTCTSTHDLFRVECSSGGDNDGGQVELAVCVRAELKGRVGEFTITGRVENKYGYETFKLPVNVVNVNDPPEILSPEFVEFGIEYSTKIDEVFTSLTVTDLDLGLEDSLEELSATIEPLNPDDDSVPFGATLDIFEGSDLGFVQIFVQRRLDTSAIQQYAFILKVSDLGGLSDHVSVNVTVFGVNPNAPDCSGVDRTLTASLRLSAGDVVANVTCTDADQDPLTYTLEVIDVKLLEYFNVTDEGELVVLQPLVDSGLQSPVIFSLVVDDGRGREIAIDISMKLISDFPPSCDHDEVSHSISENTRAGVCFTVKNGSHCTNRDSLEPLIFEIVSIERVSGGDTTDDDIQLVDVRPSQEGVFQLCTLKELKNKYGIWELVISVTNVFGSTSINVTVTVNDVNDPPTFSQTLFSGVVTENVASGYEVTTLTATDPDWLVYSQLQYLSTEIDNSEDFALDRYTGTIRTKKEIDADVLPEKVKYAVSVRDGGGLEAKATVEIEIVDVNDNGPECQPLSLPLDVPLTAAPGYLLTSLACTDADRSQQFKQLSYTIVAGDSTVFRVTDTGDIELVGSLSRSVTSYEITVEVRDVNMPLSNVKAVESLVIPITVNTNIPPTCTKPQESMTVRDTQAEGACIGTEVKCTDSTGGKVELTEPTLGNGTKFMTVRYHSTGQANQLALSICISGTIGYGFFQINGTVTNGLATTSITWSFVGVDVNEPPRFSQREYQRNVREDTKSNEEVLRVNVTDPDYFTPEFGLDTVTAELLNNDDFPRSTWDGFLFVSASQAFYMTTSQNATMRDSYIYRVNATDKSGISSYATAIINITDVNETPICPQESLTGTLNLLTPPQTVITTIRCYDTDLEERNRRLGYAITQGDIDGHFGVLATGALVLVKTLPRDHPGQQSLTVTVADNGTPALNTSVQVALVVKTDIPVDCDPVITPPPVWIIRACATINMYCDDPTTTDDSLTYDVTGNYTSNDFIATTTNDGVIRLCYQKTGDGDYEVSVTVGNGLLPRTFPMVIEVKYDQSTPQFSFPTYNTTISEDHPIDTTVVQVSAKSTNENSKLSYSIIDDLSTTGWSSYFNLDETSGWIISVGSLKPVANQKIKLHVQAIDSISLLKSSVQVVITVEDINEVPECTITSQSLDINVDSPMDNTVLVEFSCQDEDSVESYSSLSYSITGELVSSYFKLFPANQPSSVRIRAPLSVTKASYDIVLTVEDRGSPPLSFTRTFAISVDLTPPQLQIAAVALKSDTVRVTWRYEREDFYSVTSGYVVTFTTPGDIRESPVQDRAIRVWNETPLKPNTPYTITVIAKTDYGDVSSSHVSVRTPEVPVIVETVVTIRQFGEEFDPQLRMPGSDERFEYTSFVSSNIDTVLGGLSGFTRLEIIDYRNGSIFIDMKIYVNERLGSVLETIETLNATVSTGWIGDMAVDSTYFVASQGGGYVMVNDVTSSPARAHQGDDVTMTCVAVAVGFGVDEEVTIWWTVNGIRINPTSSGRLQVRPPVSDGAVAETITSTLAISDVHTRDAGVYACLARQGEGQVSSKSTSLSVIPQPQVTIEPKSKTVRAGETVDIICELVSPKEVPVNFILFKNGALLQAGTDESINNTKQRIVLTVENIRRNVVYGCVGENEAGQGGMVESHIGFYDDTGTDADQPCPAITDNMGTQWPITAPGAVAKATCQSGSSGEISRNCTSTGVWQQYAVNTCVRGAIADVETQVSQSQEGVTTTPVNQSMSDLATATDPATTGLSTGELNTVNNILDTVTTITREKDDADESEADNIVQVVSNMISPPNEDSWKTLILEDRDGAMSVATVVEEYFEESAPRLLAGGPQQRTKQRFSKDYLFAEIGQEDSDILFPDRSDIQSLPNLVKGSNTNIRVPREALAALSDVQYTGFFYGDIATLLTMNLLEDGEVKDVTGELNINSDVLALQVIGLKGKTIDPPALVTFQLYDRNHSKPRCSFWDENISPYGAWSTEGSWQVSSGETEIVCAFNHFTNFAVLMSPGTTPEADILAMSIISAVGCGISILCLIILLVLYFIVWRYIKSDRTVLLVNLCIALLLAYIIFLAGIDRAENKDVCTAISALLHYIWLVVFFLMLAEGIEIAVSVIYVFVTRSRLKWLLPLAWGIPAIVVGVSLGVTKLEGYGNETYCWLSLESGLLWAFVGPAALVILINFIIILVVFKQMFRSSAMLTKTDKEKAKASLRSLCILVPILGLTWVFGIFSVNRSLVAFQYIFAVCNSLQGLFILLFHGVFNRQVRDALRAKQTRKRSLATFESSLKTPSTGGSTSFVKSDEVPKKSNTDQPKPTGTNPFLEADRQVQELHQLVGKKGNDYKLYDNAVKNNMLDKNNVDVDLEDVKISNILRESEVMSGAAGISSILPATTASVERETGEVPKKETDTGIRQSVTSSHKYDYIDPSPAPSQPQHQPKPPGYEKLLQPYEKKLSSSYDRLDGRDPTGRTGPTTVYERQRVTPDATPQGSARTSQELTASGTGKSSRSSRSDDDPEARMRERQSRLENVYLPEAYRSSEAAKQARVAEAMPSKFNPKSPKKGSQKKPVPHQGKAKDMAAAKKQLQSQQARKKPTKDRGDRSKAYQYSYDMSYLGGQSRHSSLENMPMHYAAYNPYSGMQAQGRRTQQWDQQYPWSERHPDYW